MMHCAAPDDDPEPVREGKNPPVRRQRGCSGNGHVSGEVAALTSGGREYVKAGWSVNGGDEKRSTAYDVS